MNFFEANCKEAPRADNLFGICDAQDGSKAYTTTTNQESWGATVKNDQNLEVVFTAIDKCVIKDDEHTNRGRCDGMLTTDSHIYFVELKDKKSDWLSGSIEQLESTVQFFLANHDISGFRHRKAFACNKQHKHFKEIDNELNLRFFRTYGVRIDAQAELILI